MWLYREPHIKTLVANERKEGAKENKKASSDSSNSKTRGHPDVFICGERHQIKDCVKWKQVLALTKKKP